jgi:exosome complex exonuclease RRP6
MNGSYPHPYEAEIRRYRYPGFVYQSAEPVPYLPFDTTKAVWVDTRQAVAEMVAELKLAKEIAIDLEHHDARSYIGIVSLMQISTRDKDWVIDTLVPWRHELQVLNEVFTDPKILKVGFAKSELRCRAKSTKGFTWGIHGYYLATT